eukprot:TRINITY_DN73889_c0_g1_i1.p1 TRINITY_DN73889_c0_g1~~TRINITY_DN73889_c0_g1_i1.p1  ORF type:complete len:939 (+),score=102.75 TRINITY_DN73889_c0_g1_i1:85-2817(+)
MAAPPPGRKFRSSVAKLPSSGHRWRRRRSRRRHWHTSSEAGAAAVAVAAAVCWQNTAEAFHVPVDREGVASLMGQFYVMKLPRVACTGLSGGWDATCAHGLTAYVECAHRGFQYSMEWHFAEIISQSETYLAPRPEDARYVYFPQCVSQVYFAMRDTYNMTHWEAIASAEQDYLVPLLRWAHGSPLHKRYSGRNFWTVFSMDLGRQDFPRSAAWLEQWSVGSLTGSEHWLQGSGQFNRELARREDNTISDQFEGCKEEVALARALFPARNYRAHDTVISIPSPYSPAERSIIVRNRPVFVFFVGSPNSCARRSLLKYWGGKPGFDVSSEFLSFEGYRQKMLSARFCPVMCGSSHTNNVRLYDVIANGCVPVVISDDFQPPLDTLLPWEDIAVFLHISSIPRLEEILRGIEANEQQMNRLFENVALGSTVYDIGRADRLIAESGGTLDRDSLWSGLSAARIFNWYDSAFWMLFLFDVSRKLDKRIEDISLGEASVQCISLVKNGGDVKPAVSREHAFAWRREIPCYAHLHASDARGSNSDNGVGVSTDANKTDSVRRVMGSEGIAMGAGGGGGTGRAHASLLAALQWLFHRRRVKNNGASPGVLVDCFVDGAWEDARWFEAFSGRQKHPFAANVRGELGTKPLPRCGDFAAVSLEPSQQRLHSLRRKTTELGWPASCWRAVHAPLAAGPGGISSQASLLLATSEMGLGSDAPAIFALRVGRRCLTEAMLMSLHSAGAGVDAAPVKFLLLDTSEAAWRVSVADLANDLADGGWLCFQPSADGRLWPVFSPFEGAHVHGDGIWESGLFCGRDGDSDLDVIVRLLSGGSVAAGPPPARWAPTSEGRLRPVDFGSSDDNNLEDRARREALVAAAAAHSARGRFLYSATTLRTRPSSRSVTPGSHDWGNKDSICLI